MNASKRKILTYDDLRPIGASENNEPLVDVQTFDDTIIANYSKPDMLAIAGRTIFVRESVARKLAKVNAELFYRNSMRLKIVYGYRHPDIQQSYFSARRLAVAKSQSGLSDAELDQATHAFVAVPEVAGHPTGGAVDLTVVDGKGEVDMGTKIADYTDPKKIETDYVSLTVDQKRNRQILHDAMVAQGFAPFYGEWWHFSYGDKEWAAFYGHPQSLYSPIDYRA
jgi:D-alanyl-D-alanine dipeptidase